MPRKEEHQGLSSAHLLFAVSPYAQSFADKIVEESAADTEFVWIHDYHLLVLPSLLRKRFNRIRAGVFLHSPFPSSEIFRTFPKREELLRSLLNADLIGVHMPGLRACQAGCACRAMGAGHRLQMCCRRVRARPPCCMAVFRQRKQGL